MKLRRLGIDERKGKGCTTMGHEGRAATFEFEAGGITSYYCSECGGRLIKHVSAPNVAGAVRRNKVEKEKLGK